MCKHGAERKETIKKHRPNQHSIKFGCQSFVRFYRRVSGIIVLTSYNEDHSTPYSSHISDEIFHRDTDVEKIGEDDELIENLMAANCKAGQINKMLELKKHLQLTTSAVRYKMKKLKGDNKEDEELHRFMTQLVEEGGHVNKLENKDGTVRVLTITTKEMFNAFIGSDPSVLQIDTTFNFESSGYKLSCILYLNPATGKGEVVQLSFLEDEAADAYSFSFSTLRKIIGRDPPVLVIDKDFNELNILKSVFPTSNVLLCRFHVLKYWKTLISTAMVEHDRKADIMEAFRSLVFAHSQATFCSQLTEWMKVIKGVEIRVGSGEKSHYVGLRDFYVKNWGSCLDMWVLYLRKKLPGLGEENTNNRIERAFGCMKQHLKLYTSGEVTIFSAIMHLVRWAEDQLTCRYTAALRHRMRIYDHDPTVRELYRQAAIVLNDSGCMLFKLSIEKLRELKTNMKIVDCGVLEKFNNSNESEESGSDAEEEASEEAVGDIVNQGKETYYKCDGKFCSCSFWFRHLCPCRHILLVRDNSNLPLFERSLFDKKYYYERKEDLQGDATGNIDGDSQTGNIDGDSLQLGQYEIEDTEVEFENFTVNSREEKFKRVQPVMERISEILLHFGSEKLEEYIIELLEVEKKIRTGKRILSNGTEQSQSSSSTSSEKVEEERYVKDSETEERGEDSKTTNKVDYRFKGKVLKRGRPKGGGSKVRFIRRMVKSKRKTARKLKKSILRGKKILKSRRKVPTVKVSELNTTSPAKLIKDKISKKRGGRRLGRGRTKAKSLIKNWLEEDVTVSESEDTISSPVPPNPLVCYFPGLPGSQRSLNNSDYYSLKPGRFLTDVTIDFAFSYEEIFRDPKEVLLLSTEFAQILGGGNWWDDERLNRSLLNSKLWQDDGVKLVLLPVCYSSHFYGLVAVLDPVEPLLYILESLGGCYSKEPPVATDFRDFLSEQKQLLDGSRLEFKTVTPIVPRQAAGSNNCGLFLIQFMRKIVENPTNFIERATSCDLAKWFPPLHVDCLRAEISKLLFLMAIEQREPSQALAGKSLQITELQFS